MRIPRRQDCSCRAVLAILCLLAPVTALTGCRRAGADLEHTFDSPDALAREVLTRLARRDQGGLRALAVTHDEFEAHVWPKLPASRPERNMPMSFVWGRLKQQSDLSLAGTVSRLGGRSFTLQQLLFEGDTTDYGTFTVRRDSVLVVRTPEGGVERIRVFGSMLTMNGRHKVFSYVVD